MTANVQKKKKSEMLFGDNESPKAKVKEKPIEVPRSTETATNNEESLKAMSDSEWESG